MYIESGPSVLDVAITIPVVAVLLLGIVSVVILIVVFITKCRKSGLKGKLFPVPLLVISCSKQMPTILATEDDELSLHGQDEATSTTTDQQSLTTTDKDGKNLIEDEYETLLLTSVNDKFHKGM